jgi:HJR/Mrr/RecB family endonuclease
VGSYVQLVAVDKVVSFPVDVKNKIHTLSKRFIREVASHTEMYD